MGDFSEIYQAMRDEKKLKHAQWHDVNTKWLRGSGISFREASHECYIFREVGKPAVDFYPSTGRWRVSGLSRTFSGGAQAFINWYKKQCQK